MFAFVFILFSCDKENNDISSTETTLEQQKIHEQLVSKIVEDQDYFNFLFDIFIDYSNPNFDLPKARKEIDFYHNNVIKEKYPDSKSLTEQHFKDLMGEAYIEIMSIAYRENLELRKSAGILDLNVEQIGGDGAKILYCGKDFPCCLFPQETFRVKCFRANCVSWTSSCY